MPLPNKSRPDSRDHRERINVVFMVARARELRRLFFSFFFCFFSPRLLQPLTIAAIAPRPYSYNDYYCGDRMRRVNTLSVSSLSYLTRMLTVSRRSREWCSTNGPRATSPECRCSSRTPGLTSNCSSRSSRPCPVSIADDEQERGGGRVRIETSERCYWDLRRAVSDRTNKRSRIVFLPELTLVEQKPRRSRFETVFKLDRSVTAVRNRRRDVADNSNGAYCRKPQTDHVLFDRFAGTIINASEKLLLNGCTPSAYSDCMLRPNNHICIYMRRWVLTGWKVDFF